jgi:glycosidase
MSDETNTDIVQRPRRQELGRLISYNQFPLHYHNIKEMETDLPRIRQMGFTSVWTNPLFEPCQSVDLVKHEFSINGDANEVHSDPGSIYATRSFNINHKLSGHNDEAISESERRKRDYADIRHYTDAARAQGLTPLYDFVMRQVAVDNPLLQKKPHWFKRHSNGNYVFFGRDENYRATGVSWDDVVEFNYDNPAVRKEVVNEYLKPMADIVVKQFGFEGFRIDAAGKLPRSVYEEIIPYVDKLCKETHGKPAVIIGETLGQNINEFLHTGGYMDYIYNSIYFQPFNSRKMWEKDDTWFAHTKGQLQEQVAPTIGFPENHDVIRLADFYGNNRHIRDEILRHVITACCLNGKIPLPKVLNIFTSLNDKEAFSEDTLRKLVATGVEQKAISPEAAAKAYDNIATTGKLKQQDVRSWFRDHPPTTDKAGERLFRALSDVIFDLVAQEKEKEIYEMRTYNERQTPKLISENNLIALIPEGKLSKERLERLVREAYCFTAFASDGGWFMPQGSEYGVSKRSSVSSGTPEDLNERPYPDIDLSPFIRSVNATVAALPPPSNPEWVQRCYLDDTEKDKCLSSFLIHQGEGYSNGSHLVIANIGTGRPIVDYNTFMHIRSANKRNDRPEKDVLPNAVYLCGDIELSPHLRAALIVKKVKIFESDKQTQQAQGAAHARINQHSDGGGLAAS